MAHVSEEPIRGLEEHGIPLDVTTETAIPIPSSIIRDIVDAIDVFYVDNEDTEDTRKDLGSDLGGSAGGDEFESCKKCRRCAPSPPRLEPADLLGPNLRERDISYLHLDQSRSLKRAASTELHSDDPIPGPHRDIDYSSPYFGASVPKVNGVRRITRRHQRTRRHKPPRTAKNLRPLSRRQHGEQVPGMNDVDSWTSTSQAPFTLNTSQLEVASEQLPPQVVAIPGVVEWRMYDRPDDSHNSQSKPRTLPLISSRTANEISSRAAESENNVWRDEREPKHSSPQNSEGFERCPEWASLWRYLVELDDLEREVTVLTDESSETDFGDCISVPSSDLPTAREEIADVVAQVGGLSDSEPRLLRYPLHKSVEIEHPLDAGIAVEEIHEKHGEQRRAEGSKDSFKDGTFKVTVERTD